MNAQELKSTILQMGMLGQLTERSIEDEPVDQLMTRIRERRQLLFKEGMLKKSKVEQPTIQCVDGLWYECGKRGVRTPIEDEAVIELPEGWTWARIETVILAYTGNSIPARVKAQKYEGLQSGRDYIATKDLGFDHCFNYDNGVKIPEDESRFRVAYANDTLMCIEGGSAGRKIGLLDRDVCFGNKLCNFHSFGINARFIYYFLQSPVFLRQFKSQMTGIIGGVSIKSIEAIFICIPPLQEQERIVEQLDILLPLVNEYGALEQKRRDIHHALPGQLTRSILQYAFEGKLVDHSSMDIVLPNGAEELTRDKLPLEIPKEWKVASLSSLCTGRISYGIIKLGDEHPNDGVKTLRCSDVKPGYIVEDTIRTVSKQLSEQYSRTILEANDVVVNVRGTLGGVAVIPDHLIGSNVAREVAVIRLKDKNMSGYIMYLLMSPYFDSFMRSSLRGIAYKGLNMGILSKLPVPIPPEDEREAIVKTLENAIGIIGAIREDVALKVKD